MVSFMAYKGIVARRVRMNGNNSTTRLNKYVRPRPRYKFRDRKSRTESFRSFLFKAGTIAVVSFPSCRTGINSVDKVIDFVDSRQNVSCFIFLYIFFFFISFVDIY